MGYTHKLNESIDVLNSEALLVGIYKESRKSKKFPVFKAKLSQKRNHYPELDLFRQQIDYEKWYNKHPSYSINKGKVFRYRAAFYSLSILFLVLSFLIFSHTLHWSSSLFFSTAQLAKSLICLSSLMLSVLSLWMGYSLCVAKEATNHLVSRAKRELVQMYARKKIEHGAFSILSWGYHTQAIAELKQAYYESLDRIEDRKEETLIILQKIRYYKEIDAKTKEILFNQALSDMNDQLSILIHSFKNTFTVRTAKSV